MPLPSVPAPVRAFVTSHARTLDELQLLMALIQSGDRWWDAATASHEFGITTAAAQAALEHFAAGNLLEIRITGALRYQFRPGTAELADAARATLDLYRTRPLDLARLVGGPRRSLRDFADAFRIRRTHDDR